MSTGTGNVTLALVEQETADVTIPIKVGKMSGHFIGEAIIRSKSEMKELTDEMRAMAEALEASDEEEEVKKQKAKEQDEELLRKLYSGFRGLGNDKREPLNGDAAYHAILHGKYSSYLMPAAVTSYYKQYGEALQANLPKRRWR